MLEDIDVIESAFLTLKIRIDRDAAYKAALEAEKKGGEVKQQKAWIDNPPLVHVDDADPVGICLCEPYLLRVDPLVATTKNWNLSA